MEIKTFNHGKGKIDLTYLNDNKHYIFQASPISLHLKEDGDIHDGPSFCMVMESINVYCYGQFSLETIQQCFDELGYQLVKKPLGIFAQIEKEPVHDFSKKLSKEDFEKMFKDMVSFTDTETGNFELQSPYLLSIQDDLMFYYVTKIPGIIWLGGADITNKIQERLKFCEEKYTEEDLIRWVKDNL